MGIREGWQELLAAEVGAMKVSNPLPSFSWLFVLSFLPTFLSVFFVLPLLRGAFLLLLVLSTYMSLLLLLPRVLFFPKFR